MLLDKLKAKQEQLNMNDVEFAARLGVPRSTWQLTRSGRVPLGGRVARAAQRAFPELAGEVVLFLLSDASQEAGEASVESTSVA